MIDLLKPNTDDLKTKWADVLRQVRPLNKWDAEEEIAWWCEYATRCTNLIELGAYNGASTRAMRLANPDLKIHVIDLWEDDGTFETFKGALADDITAGYVTYERADTVAGLTDLNGSFDGLLIDAGHLYHHVESDLRLGLPFIKEGVLVCGHDYRVNLPDDGVTRAVRERFSEVFNPTCSVWAAYNR
jgi:predicted O-methyltransferase YrrM